MCVLQTQPLYLAQLIFLMPQNKTTLFMETVIFTLFNYGSDCREAYLLLQLFTTALRHEIKSVFTHYTHKGCQGCQVALNTISLLLTPSLLSQVEGGPAPRGGDWEPHSH